MQCELDNYLSKVIKNCGQLNSGKLNIAVKMPQLKMKLQNRLISGHYSQTKTVGILGYFVKGILKEAIRTINHEDTSFFSNRSSPDNSHIQSAARHLHT